MATAIPKHCFMVDEYHRMVNAGILGKNDLGLVACICLIIICLAPTSSAAS